MPKVSVITQGATEIVVVDFSGCTPGTYSPVTQEAQRVIRARPLRSVRVVTVFQDVRFDTGTVKEMQDYATAVMPHLARCGLVGIDGLKKIVFGGIKSLFSIPVKACADLDEAKQFVTSDSE